jgi:predicted deacylase
VAKAERAGPLTIGGERIAPGERRTIELPLARVFSHVELNMVVQIARGHRAGPTLCVCAGIHGDEINGVEILRRLLKSSALSRIRGTLIAVPVVNMFGFLQQTRYLPDRRDLNRSFPGSERGSLAARLANLFMTEIVANCDHAIDLHTGAIHRTNLPQIRACLGRDETPRMAQAFGAPVIIDAALREGSLRAAAHERGIPMLVYEGGEALRFDELAIRVGVRGVTSVMRELGMLSKSRGHKPAHTPTVALDSSWVRSPDSGILQHRVPLGSRVRAGDTLGVVVNPFGEGEGRIVAPNGGIVIDMTQIPLLNEGDAAFHIAAVQRPGTVQKAVEALQATTYDDHDPEDDDYT